LDVSETKPKYLRTHEAGASACIADALSAESDSSMHTSSNPSPSSAEQSPEVFVCGVFISLPLCHSFVTLLSLFSLMPNLPSLLCSMQVFGSGNFAGSGVEDSAFIQELEAAYTAAVSREGDCKLAEALLNKEEVSGRQLA
jgi:hypothetical protein